MSFLDRIKAAPLRPSVATVATVAVASDTNAIPDDIRQMILGIAPNVDDELVFLIWRDSFNPAVLGDQEERIAHVQWWADLARDHPGMVMKACTETPAYLWYLSKPKEPTQ